MNWLAKVGLMFGLKRQEPRSNDPIKGDYARAYERNELAGQRAREALTDTLQELAGRM